MIGSLLLLYVGIVIQAPWWFFACDILLLIISVASIVANVIKEMDK